MRSTYAQFILLGMALVLVGYFASTVPPLAPLGWIAEVAGIILFSYGSVRFVLY